MPDKPEADDTALTQLDALLGREEAALTHLERLLWEERSFLFEADPRRLLEKLAEIEEALSRVEQSDLARKRLVGRSETDPGESSLIGTRSSVPLVWAFRQRLLGLIARVAALNEANGHLTAGLSRVADGSLACLRRLGELDRPQLTGPFARSQVERSETRLEIQA